MMLNEDLFRYFASDPLDPTFKVFDVFRDKNHDVHNLLIDSIKKIDYSKIENIKKDKLFQHVADINNPMGEDVEAGLWLIVNYLHDEVPKSRLQIFKSQDNSKRPPPYNHEALSDVTINEHKLVPLSQFEINGTGLSRNGYSFSISPVVHASNSSYWLMNFLKRSKLKDHLWLRLDPFICRKSSEYRSLEYRMWVYGTPLDWDGLKTLRKPHTGQWIPDILSNSGIEITDFVWHPYDDELHFTCEELQKSSYLYKRGSRYFHAIYDKNSDEITHLDGAIRIFDNETWAVRRDTHLSKVEARKAGHRIKLFQINSTISVDQFSGLAASFFVWNQDVINYFTQGAKPSA